MRHEAKLATVENVVTAICFGVGALLVVLALYTLVAVKSVNARNVTLNGTVAEPAGPDAGAGSLLFADAAVGERELTAGAPRAHG